MIDFHSALCQVFINPLTVKAQNTSMKFIFLLNTVSNINHLFKG